ncbi:MULTISPECIES: hypothetical protein [unclassified Dehalobacter]|uniref:XkdQ/YqbQ family protein n=1 Tax=unclassified Dehalobacter TaxID=2635733 RepID=UPI00104C4F01|nr:MULTISPECIES: hypothetical protein [unclassified Dehalobacter]TCX51922.1 hypothetical protein C1I36_06285 [Dehalobacter sp. 14DCB1]TCX52982.1 hypothetical protein C1I38_07965 [Dehalobacter sp. 12DCB1]
MIGCTLIQAGKTMDISELVSDMTWSGRKGAAGRSVSMTLLDAPEYTRSGIDIEKGCQCIATWKGAELLRGLVVSQGRGKSKKLSIASRDNLIYMANNDDTFSYKNRTASQIFVDVCTRFQISYDVVADTKYVIPSVSLESGKLWDVILEAMSLTYKATGQRYYVVSFKGKVSLLLRKEAVQQWVIEDGQNLIDYDFNKSIESLVTRVKMVGDQGTLVASAVNAELEKKFGIFQKIIQKDNDLNAGQLQEVTNSTLKLEGLAQESLSVTGLGIETAISGTAIYLIIPDLDIRRSYYIDEDSHTFRGNYHEMKLTLNKTNEF